MQFFLSGRCLSSFECVHVIVADTYVQSVNGAWASSGIMGFFSTQCYLMALPFLRVSDGIRPVLPDLPGLRVV